MRTRKGTVAVVAVIAILLGIVCVGLFQDFDAQGYVLAILDQRFLGEVEGAKKMIEDVTEEEFLEQYEQGITDFVTDHITNGIQVDTQTEERFAEICKEIFAEMKYKVCEAEKVNRKEYHVTVEYEPSDVFLQFVDRIQKEAEDIREKVDQGEYKGTKEEINRQMQKDFLKRAYELLEDSYESMQYGEQETMVFQVRGDEKHVFSVREEDISSFITKILRLDEIQD